MIDQFRQRQEERKNGINTASGGAADGQELSDDSDPGNGAASTFSQVMAEFKQALANPKLNKKNFAQTAGESVKHLKQTIFKLKTSTQLKQ